MRAMAALLAFASGAALAPGPGAATGRRTRPASDAEVLQQRAAGVRPGRPSHRPLRAASRGQTGRTRAPPTSSPGPIIEFGRKVGDAHYAGYAEAVIAPWLARADPPPALLVTQATILQYRHEFRPGARAACRGGRGGIPRSRRRGFRLPRSTCSKATTRAPATRCGRAGRHGGTRSASRARPTCACRPGKPSGRWRCWRRSTRRGAARVDRRDCAPKATSASGRWQDAEAHYRRALEAAPDDNFLLVGYADLLLDRGRAKEVIALLADYGDSDTAFLRLALAHAALGRARRRAYRWTMAARFEAYAQRGERVLQPRGGALPPASRERSRRGARRRAAQLRAPAGAGGRAHPARSRARGAQAAAAAPAIAFVDEVEARRTRRSRAGPRRCGAEPVMRAPPRVL